MSLTQAILCFLIVAFSMLIGVVIYLARQGAKEQEANKEFAVKIETSKILKDENDKVTEGLLDSNRTGVSGWKQFLRDKNRNN